MATNKLSGHIGINNASKQFAACLARSGLRGLVLEDAGLGEDNFPLLAASLPVPLQVLNVAGNDIGDGDIQALADNFNTTNLTSLNLSRKLNRRTQRLERKRYPSIRARNRDFASTCQCQSCL